MTVNRNYKSFRRSVYYIKRESSKKNHQGSLIFPCHECDRVGPRNWKRKQDDIDFPQLIAQLARVVKSCCVLYGMCSQLRMRIC